MIRAGANSTMFHDRSRRRDFHDHFGLHGSDSKAKA
jgi:hypothetical protein